MLVLEEGFSDNDKYLINEYLKHKTQDFLLTELSGRYFVVPYKYTIGSKTVLAAQNKFFAALLDFEDAEIQKYKDAGLTPNIVRYNRRNFVVPFNDTEHLSPEQLANRCFDRAFAKYNAIINAARGLEAKGYPLETVNFTSASLDKYSKQLMELNSSVVLDKDTPQKVKMTKFLEQNADKKITKFKTSPKSMKKQIAAQAIKQEKKIYDLVSPKYYKTAVVASLLGLGAAFSYIHDKKTQLDIDPNVGSPLKMVKNVVQDFTGKMHIDYWGNFANIHQLKPEISAVLFAVEGFADKVFDDGEGNLTYGVGSTFVINEDGSTSSLKEGDTISLEMAMVQKWRYIDKYMASIFTENLGREASCEELMAGIGAGFCWGPKGFKKSSFFKSLKDSEDVLTQTNKISGFRKQKGLLKRGYLLACCLSGEWSPKDLLDLPIYYIEGKGYLKCSIYNLELHDILPCRKDENGNYLKDENGNDVPKIKQDGFCYDFYLDRAQIIKNRLIQEAKTSNKPYVTVRDLMPKEMTEALDNKYSKDNKKSFIAFFSKLLNQRD